MGVAVLPVTAAPLSGQGLEHVAEELAGVEDVVGDGPPQPDDDGVLGRHHRHQLRRQAEAKS